MNPKPPYKCETNTPWQLRFLSLVLSEKGVSGVISIAVVGILCYALLTKLDEHSSILREILSQEKVQTCILTGGVNGSCLIAAEPYKAAENEVAKAVKNGTFGGWDAGLGYNPKR